MGKNTGITWCDDTFNPWWGCTRLTAGCDACYADAWARRTGFSVWDGEPRRFFAKKHWDEPLQWNAAAAEAGERRRVFCASMCDVFEQAASAELDVPRERLWQLIEATPMLDWLLLTKRPENVPMMMPSAWAIDWPDNVWMLTTVESQEVAELRINALLSIPAKIRGLSVEPMLGPINFGLDNWADDPKYRIDWVIVGCEKLPGNRPGRRCRLSDVRWLVAECELAGVACFVKQLSINGRVSDDPADWPEDLRVQQFPRGGPR